MDSDNPSGADNQQERPLAVEWVVGFADGVGCFSVRGHRDLEDRIVPLFEDNPLRTAKARDFASFAEVVRLMTRAVHLSMEGLSQLAAIAETMNRRKPSRFVESSEAIRQPSHTDCEMKIWS